jgi:hypothetical protein
VKGDNFAPTTDYSEMDKFLSGAPFDGYAGYVVPRMRRLAACRESCGSGFWGVGVTVLCMGVVAVVGVDVMVVLLTMVYVVAAVVMVIGDGGVISYGSLPTYMRLASTVTIFGSFRTCRRKQSATCQPRRRALLCRAR